MSHKLYIVSHIPKTAGSTLESNFHRNFKGSGWLRGGGWLHLCRPSIGAARAEQINELMTKYIAGNSNRHTKCIFGHGAYFGVHKVVNPAAEPRYITFLRDPVERCISMYYWYKNTAVRDWQREIVEGNWSIEEWLEKSKNPMKSNGQLRHLLLNSYEEAFLRYNCQSRHLLLDSHEAASIAPELTREHLEEGERRLRQFWYVGLTETFDEDAHYLYGKLGFWKYNPQRVVNATPRDKEVSPATRRLIAEYNGLDMELYEFAREFRAEFIRNNALDFKRNINKARRRRALFTALPFIDPLDQQITRLITRLWQIKRRLKRDKSTRLPSAADAR